MVKQMYTMQRIKYAGIALEAMGKSLSVVLTGNGHIRNDYGISQILESLDPELRVILLAYVELKSFPKLGRNFKDYFQNEMNGLFLFTPPIDRSNRRAILYKN